MDPIPLGLVPSGYDVHSLPWFVDGPVRNRWFTELNSMVDLSMAIAVSHNQRVKIMETLEYHGNIVGIGRDQVSKYGSIWENLPFGSCRKRCIRMA
jgi:hypothetical protein